MKQALLLLLICLATASNSLAQDSGIFITDKVGNLTVHTYQSNDPLADTSFIIESENALVVIDPVAFEENISAFQNYIEKLAKPVNRILVAFHPAGLNSYPYSPKIITRPLDAFVKSEAGKGMLTNFSEIFNGAMDINVTAFDAVIDADQHFIVDGVSYQLTPTKVPGMPGSNLSINGDIFYSHFTPAANMHPSSFYITDRATLSAALEESRNAAKQGYDLFIGAHFPGRAEIGDLNFQISYLEALQDILTKADNAADLVQAMQQQFPECGGGQNLETIAAKLF
jgi:hypothetical protein